MKESERLVVVANRLPVRRVRRAAGAQWETSPGGLVSAMTPVLREREGHWVGWPGYAGDPPEPFEHEGIRIRAVGLSQDEVECFYRGFANGTLWPLYHDAVRYPEYHRSWWWPYVGVNRSFARAAADVLGDEGRAWIHDYQLQLVPGMLRELVPRARLGFFLHIPFPPMELFAQLPWRRQILEGLLGADLVGFQTALGARNFAAACRRFTEAEGTDEELEFRGRRVSIGTFPISIDFEEIDQLARTPSVQEEAARIREQVGERKIILGVDRLDYTKGIDHRLNAFETHLERYANSAEDVVFIQVAVPSRQMVQEYADMRTRIEQQVGRINGTWGEPGRVAVHYLYRNLAKEELIAYYLAAHVMAVTPLRDGMNLVAKEYVASRTDDTGVLVLSEFAGAAAELSDAVLVNPYDIDRLAEAFDQALDMRAEVAAAAMRRMRSIVRTHDVRRWANRFLEELNG